MKLKAYITRGIPASGKTTWAEAQVLENPGMRFKNINRDDIRFDMFCGGVRNWALYKFNKVNEAEVTAKVYAEIQYAAQANRNVIISDTNLNPVHYDALRRHLEEVGFEVEDVWFHIEFEEALDRNAQRPNGVNFQTMARMYRQYCELVHAKDYHVLSLDGERPAAVIFDIDGTLAHMAGNRGPFDWSKVELDFPDRMLFLSLKAYHEAGFEILLLSGRDSCCREATEAWFERWCQYICGYQIPYKLWMRAEKDPRKDTVIKYELFKTHIDKVYSVIQVHDDRPVVARMWRHKLGLKVVQHGDPENWF